MEWGSGGKWAQGRDEDDVLALTLPGPHGPQPRAEVRVLTLFPSSTGTPESPGTRSQNPGRCLARSHHLPLNPPSPGQDGPNPADLELCAGTWNSTLNQHEGGAAPGGSGARRPAPPPQPDLPPHGCACRQPAPGVGVCRQQLQSHRGRGALGCRESGRGTPEKSVPNMPWGRGSEEPRRNVRLALGSGREEPAAARQRKEVGTGSILGSPHP